MSNGVELTAPETSHLHPAMKWQRKIP
jgi:hypothetical protein